jgi:hypothetical protein
MMKRIPHDNLLYPRRLLPILFVRETPSIAPQRNHWIDYHDPRAGIQHAGNATIISNNRISMNIGAPVGLRP